MSLSELISEISSLTVSGKRTQVVVSETRAAIEKRLGAARVQVVLQAGGRTAVSETPEDESKKKGAPSFLFSNTIRVRGSEYGWLQVDLEQPKDSAHLLLSTLETISRLLALRAERVSIHEENQRLHANAAAIRSAIAASKIVSRAAGVVAAIRHVPFEQALVWIQDEAVRSKRPVADIAERVLLYQENRERLAVPGVPAA